MVSIILLNENGQTQPLKLARVPCVGEYIFHNEKAFIADRVVLFSNWFGTKALVSVRGSNII